MTTNTDKYASFASPPCFAHELEYGPEGYATTDRQAAKDVANWRNTERHRLITNRQEVPASERQQFAKAIAARLDRILAVDNLSIVSLYWPFRGELNLRSWMKRVHDSGARVALPVVEAKARPLTFRQWTPEGRMEPGIWNIPVPIDGEVLSPTIVISPVVGFDSQCFRLGYGGGFFDRTLEHLISNGERPRVIGVGHSGARIRTIYPQPHDIPMDVIITEIEQIVRSDSAA